MKSHKGRKEGRDGGGEDAVPRRMSRGESEGRERVTEAGREEGCSPSQRRKRYKFKEN